MTPRAYSAVYDHGHLRWTGNDRPDVEHARVMVIILEERDVTAAADKDAWPRMAAAALNRAYGPDEPEYTVADIKFR